MRIIDHWLDCARRVDSPNYSARPLEEDVSLLVIHNISLPPGEFGGPHIDALFCNSLDCEVHPFFEEIKHLQVSSHLLINREGEFTQYVPFNMKAWHAGKSRYEGRSECNEFSIGIELEGCDDIPYTQEQYASLQGVSNCLLKHYPAMSCQRITGHCDIAPERKTDPGPSFDWQHYLAGVVK